MSGDLVPSNDAPVPASDGGADRVSEIRDILRTDPKRYWQEDLGTELAQRESGDLITLRPEASRAYALASEEGRQLVAAWGPAFAQNLATVQEMVIRMVRDLGGRKRAGALMASFDLDVSERARWHIYDELRQPAPSVPPASAADVTLFASNPVGSDLIAEWGSAASDMIARIFARTKRFRAALDDEADFESFRGWYDRLPAQSIKAILRQLGR